MDSEKRTGDDEEAEILQEMRERYRDSVDDDQDLREMAAEDIRFLTIPGDQWTEQMKRNRKDRPCLEFPRLRSAVKQVANDQRQNRPAIKVRATKDATRKDAETMQGLIYNIEAQSSADRAYDTAFWYALTGGYGVWRVMTQWSDEAFEQDIRIKEIRNPFTVHFDPAAKEYHRGDGMFNFVTDTLPLELFKRRYPKADAVSFETNSRELYGDWFNAEQVRIAEYWRKVAITKKLLLLSNGMAVFEDDVKLILDELAAQQVTVKRERDVQTHRIESMVVSGAEVLEGPFEWAGKFLPFVPVWGELVNIDGREIYAGMIRPAKDAQRDYNFHRTAAIEAVNNAPKAPMKATPDMMRGFEKIYQNIHRDNYGVLPFNPDPKVPGGMPMREPGVDVPAGLITMAQLSGDDIKASTGIYDASLGQRSNETSGRAILARQREGDVSNFDFMDNLARAIQYTGDILVDLIPKIYTPGRQVRILGRDGSERFAVLNEEVLDEQTGQPVVLNDLRRGRFETAVAVGPSYTTQRLEAADSMIQLAGQNPMFGQILADLIIKNLDMPQGEEAEQRVRAWMLKQGLIEPNEEEQQKLAAQQPNPLEQMLQALQMKMLAGKVEDQELKNQKTQQSLQIEGAKAQPEVLNLVHEAIGKHLDNLMKSGQLRIDLNTGQLTPAVIDPEPQISIS